ncbi:MAG: hypothetical protein J6H21_04400 [Firmicutes bacterium]|nr:hypothetical protein [Bacillota bacterium]
MAGLTPFLLIVIMAVTFAQIAGNNKRAKDKFDKEEKAKRENARYKLMERKDNASSKVSEEANAPSFEADNSIKDQGVISDNNNPFEAK